MNMPTRQGSCMIQENEVIDQKRVFPEGRAVADKSAVIAITCQSRAPAYMATACIHPLTTAKHALSALPLPAG